MTSIKTFGIFPPRPCPKNGGRKLVRKSSSVQIRTAVSKKRCWPVIVLSTNCRWVVCEDVKDGYRPLTSVPHMKPAVFWSIYKEFRVRRGSRNRALTGCWCDRVLNVIIQSWFNQYMATGDGRLHHTCSFYFMLHRNSVWRNNLLLSWSIRIECRRQIRSKYTSLAQIVRSIINTMSLLAPIICDNGTGYSKVGYVLWLLSFTEIEVHYKNYCQVCRKLRSFIVS